MKLNNVTANFTKASVAGSGTAILSGSTQEAEYSVAGSGDLLASDFVAKKASASVAGSGDIKPCHRFPESTHQRKRQCRLQG